MVIDHAHFNTLINSERSIRANTMLDTRLDSMFNTTGIAKQVCRKTINQEISLSNVISSKKKKKIQSNFSNLNFEKFKIKNGWVVSSIKPPPK